jgi:ankyrin repeat protein
MTGSLSRQLSRVMQITFFVGGFMLTQWCHAQVAPSTSEIAAYQGLHAAAARGDVAAIERLHAAKADLNARDAHGRTPVHVATFAGQRMALRALVQAGAEIGALENDRYDAVTIAAVADDEETLRTLLGLGASAKTGNQPLRRHGADCRSAFGT